jgi:DNA-binding HxlR family transcriptional regulator
MQVKRCYRGNMPSKMPAPKRRSGCPLNASVEMLGDRWSLLIIRDMMVRGFQTYKEFMASDEGIASNILADRLRKLEAHGIITTEPDPSDGRKLIYLLTPKGIDLAPVLTEMVLWAARHEKTGNPALVCLMQADKRRVIAEVRQRGAAKATRSQSTKPRRNAAGVPADRIRRGVSTSVADLEAPPTRYLGPGNGDRKPLLETASKAADR